jgi:hypothetical protein
MSGSLFPTSYSIIAHSPLYLLLEKMYNYTTNPNSAHSLCFSHRPRVRYPLFRHLSRSFQTHACSFNSRGLSSKVCYGVLVTTHTLFHCKMACVSFVPFEIPNFQLCCVRWLGLGYLFLPTDSGGGGGCGIYNISSSVYR